MVVFISTDNFETYRLSVEFEMLLIITENFHLKPILPFMSGIGHFYILALSQNEIRFLQANRYHISEVDLDSTPTSLKEALWIDDPEKQIQFPTSTATPGRTNTRPSIFHGQGITEDDSNPYLVENALSGNPEERSNKDLHQAAWKVVRPIFEQDLREALGRYQELIGTGSELAGS